MWLAASTNADRSSEARGGAGDETLRQHDHSRPVTSRPARAPRDRRLLRRLQDLDRLSKRDRDALMPTLDAFLAKAQPG